LTGTQNPFKLIVENLTEDWQPVTIDYLKYVHDVVNEQTKLIHTFGQAFEVLEYLSFHNAISLEPDTVHNTFKIKKAVYNGSQ